MTTTIHSSMGLRDWLLLLALSLLWGGSFYFIGVAVKALPALTIVSARVVIAGLCLWLVLLLSNARMPRGRTIWLAFTVSAILNNVIPFSLIVWGQTHIASGLASILNASTPIFTVIAAGFLLADERFTLNRMLGVIAGFAGVVVLLGPVADEGFSGDILPRLAILGAALSYALGFVYARRFRTLDIKPMQVACGQLSMASVLMMPLVLTIDQPWTLDFPALDVTLALIALAVLSTGLAYVIYFRIMASAGATNLSLVTFLVPVTAVVLGTTLLNESLVWTHYVGILCIGAGLVCIDGRLLRRLARRSVTGSQSG